jgi:HEAT repeat protein
MKSQTKEMPQISETQLNTLLSELGSKNGMIRRRAREALERIGNAVSPYLSQRLQSPDLNVRWEAAKALGHIGNPETASALVRALMDESFEVQWLAAEGLIAMGKDALKPMLEGLVRNYGSIYMRQGAHHVLHDLERHNLLPPSALRVLDELRCIEPLEPYPVSAKHALEELAEGEGAAPGANRS